jgi:SAM-dependent methyltransferase
MVEKKHWETVYQTKAADAVSWYRPHLDTSLALIDQVTWISADIMQSSFPAAHFDLWHDRALFHFLTAADQRAAYVERLTRALKPGGHAVIATFGPQGPEKCSGLDTMRYDAESLHAELGSRFALVEHSTELHHTPFDTTQQFIYAHFRLH